MAEAVYVLCALTSIACAVLLLRGHARTGNRLLLWSGACFGWLALNNVLLFVDLVVLPGPATDLSLYRAATAVLGVATLIYGLVWEAQ